MAPIREMPPVVIDRNDLKRFGDRWAANETRRKAQRSLSMSGSSAFLLAHAHEDEIIASTGRHDETCCAGR